MLITLMKKGDNSVIEIVSFWIGFRREEISSIGRKRSSYFSFKAITKTNNHPFILIGYVIAHDQFILPIEHEIIAYKLSHSTITYSFNIDNKNKKIKILNL